LLKGRLGLETARVPHVDRHGLLWLQRGRLYVEDGTLRFLTKQSDDLPAGDYGLPFQSISCLVCGPGTSFTHDALRLLARHGTGLLCAGEGGVRLYASMPFGPDESARARRQVTLWSDPQQRILVARRMYAIRLGEVFPDTDLDTLRGMEGARMRSTYQRLGEQFGVKWVRRYYDRQNPDVADLPNQAINHAATAVEAAALVAVAAAGAIPQLGFIHEDSGVSFPLDIADLFRDTVTLPVAFGSVREFQKAPRTNIEQMTRHLAAKTFRRETLVTKMIDRIKWLLDNDDGNCHP
jgi:CRISPR-associated protein Cas1